VRGLDAVLRRIYGIRPVNDDPRCIFRIAGGVSDCAATLSDGVQVAPGDAVVELHLWNEHVPRMPPLGPDLAWALEAKQRLEASLSMLAEEVGQSRWQAAVAVRAALAASGDRQSRHWTGIMRKHGIDVFEVGAPVGWRARARRLGEDLLLWALARTFNPASAGGRVLHRKRLMGWISRQRLLTDYGPGPRPAASGEPERQPGGLPCSC